jgi:hypothetical protein
MLLISLLLACQGDPALPVTPPLTPVLWEGEDVRPVLDHPFFDSHALEPLSLYAMCVEGEDRPDASHRGPFGVGNGSVFSLLGLADPLNRLHNTVGPVYDKGMRFFGDHWFTLEVDGVLVPFDKECIARPRGTSLVVTRADAGDWTLTTVDFAPMDGPPVLVRFFLLESRADGEHDVAVRHHAYMGLEPDADSPMEAIGNDRVLGLHAWEGELVPDADGWTMPLDDRAVLAIGMADDTAGLDEIWATTDAASPDAWLDEALEWWRAWSAEGVQVQSDDPRVDDLYDGVRSAIRVQQGALGGISPLSRYTGVWLRDTIGPTRFLLRAGRPDEALDNLEYLYACHVEKGDYGNACESGLDPSAVGDPPDWDAMGGMGGRTGAEGPTYVPLGWLDHARWTNDLSHVQSHWSYLRRGLVAQEMDEEGRQTFSGDETFRLTMGVANGYPLEYEWDDLAWSANSSILMLAAAPRMAEAAVALGHDPVEFEDLGDAAQNALDTVFLQDGGFYAPFIFHTAGNDNEAGETAQEPYEDVNLKVLWAGALAPDDPVALSDLQRVQSYAGRGDGTVQSPPHESYAGTAPFGVEIGEGAATGMVPGYNLFSLTAIGAPEAEAAFNALHRYAGPSGQYAEAIAYADLSALQAIYDQSGGVGDVAARFRPWEGAINMDAMLSYLAGVEPIEGGMRIRPHLPNDQHRLDVRGIRAGVAAGDLCITGDRTSRRVTFTAETAFTLVVEVPVPEGAADGVALPGGEWVVPFAPVEVEAGEVVDFKVSWEAAG